MNKLDNINLKTRYLIWFYKTTKEALDKIERKFTQLEVDRIVLKELEKQDKNKQAAKFIEEFKTYMQNKEKAGLALKYENNSLKPEYSFLVMKLAAIEKTINKELGKKALSEIKALYEAEMTKRILRSTEH